MRCPCGFIAELGWFVFKNSQQLRQIAKVILAHHYSCMGEWTYNFTGREGVGRRVRFKAKLYVPKFLWI